MEKKTVFIVAAAAALAGGIFISSLEGSSSGSADAGFHKAHDAGMKPATACPEGQIFANGSCVPPHEL
jgi:hypothetical protein